MQEAITQADLKAVGRLMKEGIPENAVEEAVKSGNEVVVARLVMAGGKVSDAVFDEMLVKGMDIAGLAVDCGFEVKGKSVVARAAGAGRYNVAESLLERGCPANEVDNEGNTAFHYAAKAAQADLIKALVLFSADCNVKNKEGKTPLDMIPPTAKQLLKEAKKAPTPKDKATAMSLRFKEQGNKTFKTGEFCKAVKFYSVAISHDPTNHVLFSNRSASLFNQGAYVRGLADASLCVKLNPSWAKGYFRKGSCLTQLEMHDEALQTYNDGLKIDKKNADLIKAKQQLEKTMKKK